MAIIQFKDVWEMYRIKFIIDGKSSWENYWALKCINFDIERGETVGIIGENGAGKSTILKLIAGMLNTDRGEVIVSGKVAGLLELGAGFEPELTGKENIYLNANLFGLSQNQIDEKYVEIVNFADIGKFIHAPVKCYSQGMFVRLAFAIAIHMDPDILLIDDTLAVGDEYFQRKCIKKIFEIREQGKTIVFVSHDINMLRRLCERALLIKEGRVIRDDSVDKIIPLYSQMIGNREGIVVLENKPLSLVFNNGRILLNWYDKLLTPNSGAYASFLAHGKWYNSLQAVWEVKKDEKDRIVAIGRFFQLALTQIWKLEIVNDYEIKLDIEIISDEPLEIHEGCINVILSNEYTEWFTPLEKGEFPDIDERHKDWQAMIQGGVFRECIGAKAKDNPYGNLPSLIIEASDFCSADCAQIFNTDYVANCRVLQFNSRILQNYSKNQTDRLVYFSGKIILATQDINNFLKRLEDKFVLQSDKLRLTFDKGLIILGYGRPDYPKVGHLLTSVFANERWYSSDLAHWEIWKENQDRLIVRGIWDNLPFSQIWEIEKKDDSSFLCKIRIQVKEAAIIEQQHVQFICSKHYTHWFSEYGSGKFPEKFLETEMDMLQRCIPDGYIGLQDENNKLPVLSVRFSKELDNFGKIFNSHFYTKTRILRVDKVEAEKDTVVLPGEYHSFALEFSLGESDRMPPERHNNLISDGKLGFLFDNGSGRIYWDGVELTKKLGLYTSLRSGGRWHDSASSAIWKVQGVSNNTVRVSGSWLYLPLRQYWEIGIEEGRRIRFMAELEVEREFEAERLQANLMLSERYSHWLTENECGEFPSFKRDVEDDWHSIKTAKEKYIGASETSGGKEPLVNIAFSPESLTEGWVLKILNSDIYHRGRVLQYLNDKPKKIIKGRYPYFRGVISLAPRD